MIWDSFFVVNPVEKSCTYYFYGRFNLGLSTASKGSTNTFQLMLPFKRNVGGPENKTTHLGEINTHRSGGVSNVMGGILGTSYAITTAFLSWDSPHNLMFSYGYNPGISDDNRLLYSHIWPSANPSSHTVDMNFEFKYFPKWPLELSI